MSRDLSPSIMTATGPALMLQGVQDSDVKSVSDFTRLLDSASTTREDVESAARELSDGELLHYGLRAYRMNFLALFGKCWDRNRILVAARAATVAKIVDGWNYHQRYLPSLGPTQPDRTELYSIPFEAIRRILSAGRGLVIATFHVGQMRFIPSDLAHAGISLTLPLARDAFGEYAAARALNPEAAVWQHLALANVEERRGTVTLARTLAQGGCIAAAIDGNTGLDGARGEDRRTVVEMLGSQVRVKTGLLLLAARFGAPVLPVSAVTRHGRPIWQSGTLIDPGAALSTPQATAFAVAAAAAAYSFMGKTLREHPEQWSGGDLFHQWRVPSPPIMRDSHEIERLIRDTLDGGDALVFDDRRVCDISGQDASVVCDVLTGRCHVFPSEDHALFKRLRNHWLGVDKRWLAGHDVAARSRAEQILRRMAGQGILANQRRHNTTLKTSRLPAIFVNYPLADAPGG